MPMPGVLSGLNHSLEIQAWGRTRMPLLGQFVVQGEQTILEPGALDRDPQVLEPDLKSSSSGSEAQGNFLLILVRTCKPKRRWCHGGRVATTAAPGLGGGGRSQFSLRG